MATDGAKLAQQQIDQGKGYDPKTASQLSGTAKEQYEATHANNKK